MSRMRIWKFVKIIALVTVVLAPLASGQAGAAKSYGKGATGTEITPLTEILSNPGDYDGRTVRVRGVVDAVCKNMGCWMDIKAADGHKIQIKVDDGVIVFPVAAVGKGVIAEGTVEVKELSKEDYIGWLQHMAEENGEEFDPAAIGDPPYRRIRILGTGALID